MTEFKEKETKISSCKYV